MRAYSVQRPRSERRLRSARGKRRRKITTRQVSSFDIEKEIVLTLKLDKKKD